MTPPCVRPPLPCAHILYNANTASRFTAILCRTSVFHPEGANGVYCLAPSPFDRAGWWAENIPVLVIVALLVLISRRFRFSNTSYVLMAFFIVLHTIGGHYTFERVPFGAVSDFFGFERNHFDRVAHFSVGFYAYPIAEFLMVRRLVHTRWIVALFPVFAIVTVAGAYEIIEWQYALNSDPAAGIAVVGAQGEGWDAQ